MFIAAPMTLNEKKAQKAAGNCNCMIVETDIRGKDCWFQNMPSVITPGRSFPQTTTAGLSVCRRDKCGKEKE